MLPEDDRVIESCRRVLNVLMYILDFLTDIYIYIYIYMCVCVFVCVHVLVCVIKYPQLVFLACCDRQSITPVQNIRPNYSYVYFNLIFLDSKL